MPSPNILSWVPAGKRNSCLVSGWTMKQPPQLEDAVVVGAIGEAAANLAEFNAQGVGFHMTTLTLALGLIGNWIRRGSVALMWLTSLTSWSCED